MGTLSSLRLPRNREEPGLPRAAKHLADAQRMHDCLPDLDPDLSHRPWTITEYDLDTVRIVKHAADKCVSLSNSVAAPKR